MDVWITGATGFLGQVVAAELTRAGHRVVATTRHATSREATLREAVRSWGGDPSRLAVHEGDIDRDDLGLTAEGRAALQQVDAVVHLAARFSFGLTWQEALQTNVHGAERVVRLAGDLPKRPHLVHAGGYRAFGKAWLARGPGDDEVVAERFAQRHGAYEASKMLSVERVRKLAPELGLRTAIVHPGVVLGHARTGRTTQRAGLGDVVHDLWHGRMPALAASADTWLPIVAVDTVAAVFRAVLELSEAGDFAVLDEDTPPLRALMAEVAGHLDVPVPRVTLPPWLVRALPRWASGVDPEALSFLEPDRYDTTSTQRLMADADLVMPPWREVLLRWLDHLVATEFLASDGRTVHVGPVRTTLIGDAMPAVLALHGLPLDGSAWDDVRSALDVPTAAVDLAGLGRSGPGEPDGAWLAGVLDHLGGRPVLLAHSLGCWPALELTLADPERVAGLVLVSPFFLQGRPPAWFTWSALAATVLSWSTEARLGPAVVAPDVHAHPALAHAATQLRRPRVAARTAAMLKRARDADFRDSLVQALAAVQVPVVLVHGARDPLRVPAPTHTTVVTIPGAGHAPMLTHVDEVAACVMGL